MKDKLKEFAQFLFRCVLAGLVILICAGIIYGVLWGLGIAPREDYSFWQQYIQLGFWFGFFAVVRDLKEYWR